MKVREIIEGVGGKKITLPDAAEQLNTTTRTLRSKLGILGMQWNQGTRMYDYVGNPERKDAVLDFDIEIAIRERSSRAIKEVTGEWERPLSAPDDMMLKLLDADTIKKVKERAAEHKPVKADNGRIEPDAPPVNPRRYTRGYYIDEDVDAVLNKVRHKSDFVNQALRIVFEGMELL